MLMKNKHLLIFFLILFVSTILLPEGKTSILPETIASSEGIIINSAYGTYLRVDSYNGTPGTGVNTVQIEFPYSSTLEQGWSLEFKLVSPVTNGEGKEFPADKLKLRWNNHHISGGTPVSSAVLGAILTPIPMSYLSYQPLITNSGFQKEEAGYRQIIINLDIAVEGGAYLEDYKTENEYQIQVEYTIKDPAGNVLNSNSSSMNFRVYPTDTPPPTEPDFTLQVAGTAKNINLDFTSIHDYQNGKSVTLSKALQIKSTAPYEVLVRANTQKFYSSDQNELPLDIVNISTLSNAGIQGKTIVLSDVDQNILTGSQPAQTLTGFDLRYFTPASDQRLLEARPESYSTILIYTLLPL